MKTIVFAYSEFGCIGIEELRAAGYDIATVFTYVDDPAENVFYRSVAKVCAENKLQSHLWGDQSETQVRSIAPDFIFSFYYRSLIPATILALAKKGAYNLHGSLLPRYRGRAPVNWVLVNGETQTGVTLHHMVARADAGDIVAQVPVDIAYEDTALTLQHKLLKAARQMLKEQLPLIAQGKAARIKQDIAQGNYCGRRTPADGQIDWNKPAEVVRNLIRAVTKPYPGAFTFLHGKKLLIWDSAVTEGKGAPGTVLSTAPLAIACGQGALVVKEGQMEEGLTLSGNQLAQELAIKANMKVGL